MTEKNVKKHTKYCKTNAQKNQQSSITNNYQASQRANIFIKNKKMIAFHTFLLMSFFVEIVIGQENNLRKK